MLQPISSPWMCSEWDRKQLQWESSFFCSDSHESYSFARANLAHLFGRLIREVRRWTDVSDGEGCHGKGGSSVQWHLSCCGRFSPAHYVPARAGQHPEVQSTRWHHPGQNCLHSVITVWTALDRACQLPTACRRQSTGTVGSFLSLPRQDRFRSRKWSQYFLGHYYSFWELTDFPRNFRWFNSLKYRSIMRPSPAVFHGNLLPSLDICSAPRTCCWRRWVLHVQGGVHQAKVV